MRDGGTAGGVSSDAWPAVHSPQLTATSNCEFSFIVHVAIDVGSITGGEIGSYE